MTVERARPKNLWRRIERWMVGMAMGMMAFILEKAVLRAVKKGAAKEEHPKPTTLTSKGGEVDL